MLTSIRKPKRLVIRGDDEKDHMFLVKGGEDLRLDQRIEQVSKCNCLNPLETKKISSLTTLTTVAAPHVVAGVTSTFSCTSFSTSTSTSATPTATATPNTIATTTADVAIIADGGAVGSAVFVAVAATTAETGTCSYTVSFYSNYLCESFFCVCGSSLDS